MKQNLDSNLKVIGRQRYIKFDVLTRQNWKLAFLGVSQIVLHKENFSFGLRFFSAAVSADICLRLFLEGLILRRIHLDRRLGDYTLIFFYMCIKSKY